MLVPYIVVFSSLSIIAYPPHSLTILQELVAVDSMSIHGSGDWSHGVVTSGYVCVFYNVLKVF